MESITEISDQWTAGFFDGEGSVWISSNKGKTYLLRISIDQSDVYPLILIQHKYGGKINTWKSKVNGKTVSKWVLENSSDVINFLDKIYPFLIVKKIQVDFAKVFMRLPWRQFGKGGKRLKIKDDEKQIDEMIAYSIKMAKPRHWKNYRDFETQEQVIDYVFQSVCEKFNN